MKAIFSWRCSLCLKVKSKRLRDKTPDKLYWSNYGDGVMQENQNSENNRPKIRGYLQHMILARRYYMINLNHLWPNLIKELFIFIFNSILYPIAKRFLYFGEKKSNIDYHFMMALKRSTVPAAMPVPKNNALPFSFQNPFLCLSARI